MEWIFIKMRQLCINRAKYQKMFIQLKVIIFILKKDRQLILGMQSVSMFKSNLRKKQAISLPIQFAQFKEKDGKKLKNDIRTESALQLSFDVLIQFYNQYSMKSQKSSFSLHNSPTNILKQYSSNINLYKIRSSIFKPKPLEQRKFSYMINTKNHLNKLIEIATDLQNQCKKSQQQNKDIKLSINFIRQQYLQRNLKQASKQGCNLIKQLKKKVAIKHGSDKLRYQSIQNILYGLQKDNKQLWIKIDEISSKISHLQNIMGNDIEFY